ncbi:MAG: primosomal protein N', partial [Planctomycetaceae bacterium]
MTDARQQQLFETAGPPVGKPSWECAADADRLTAAIVFNRPVDVVFHYVVPDELRGQLQAGQRVRAPFGRGDRMTVGFCVGLGPPPDSDRRLKSIESVIDREPLLSARMLELTRWIADDYLCSWGQVLETVVPAGVKRKSGTREVSVFRPAPHLRELYDGRDGRKSVLRGDAPKLPSKQRAVVQLLLQSAGPLTAAEISDAVGCGTSPIESLRKKGLIHRSHERRAVADVIAESVQREDDLTLNAFQKHALEEIVTALRDRQHQSFVLLGVTGSGKTEVYIQAIREVVGYGRQAIVLVPEISLTPQTIRRFRSRFDSVAVLHSHLSDVDRHREWQRIAEGNVQVVVGARSAVFAPAPQLGLIVIDEEHETSFKQDTTPRYHAREVARKRAELEGVPLVLGSATPTLESRHRAQTGENVLLELPRRVNDLPLPPVVIVDVRNDPHISHGSAIGRALALAVGNALRDGGQVILFLNLRGFSPTLWCRACGGGVKCPDCDITLTWHKDRNVALCHSCDYESSAVTHCPNCGHAGVRHLGIGTQRLEQEVKARFPDHRCLRMDSDSMRKPGSHDRALESFRNCEVDILLGTQMIAKGLDFPNVTLVGVVNADTMLHQPEFRAAERTFQLIAQVAGRTGRGEKGGRVFVQSCLPAEPAIVFASQHNYNGFAAAELAHRRELNYPPFQQLVRVILRGPRDDDVQAAARELVRQLREQLATEGPDVRVLGPAPAPIGRIRGLYRYHLQLAAADLSPVRDVWKRLIGEFRFPSGVALGRRFSIRLLAAQDVEGG